MKKIAIIGAGPGGLAAGMVLVNDYEVHIFEKDDTVGGRSKKMSLGDFHFDVGPTFLMYIEILKDVFRQAGFDLEKELDLIKLEQLYTLRFKDVTFNMSSDIHENVKMYNKYKPNLGNDYLRWLNAQQKKLEAIGPILKKPFPNLFHFLRPDVLKAVPYVHLGQSVYRHLETFNKDEHFIHSLSFQAKYLGMSSYKAPSIFTILPYLEHGLGLYHVKGGLNQINHVMAKLIKQKGGHIHLSSPVEEIVVKDGVAKALKVGNQTMPFDEIILNSDFAYSMTSLVDQKHLKKYKQEKIENMRYSVSTFMVYLGLDKTYDFAHHEILFSNDYQSYLHGLTSNQFTEDISVYVHNPSLMDDTYAPKGQSSLFILVPVPNLKANQDWPTYGETLKEIAIKMIEEKHQVNLRDHIVISKVIDPSNWANDFNVYQGAVFNLSHDLGQMLHKRPKNQFDDIKHLYLVGGGTHPGSGLPTIYQSALILKHYL